MTIDPREAVAPNGTGPAARDRATTAAAVDTDDADARQAVGDYFDWCLGTAVGRLAVAFGHGPYVNDSGKYTHEWWEERRYSWPDERGRAVDDILAAAPEDDVYCCPYLMRSDRRAKGEAVDRTLVHADVDGDLADAEGVRALGGFAVASGSPSHHHAYVRVKESLTPAEHEALCRALGRFLGAVDSKVSDNDLLRLPGTVNHKPGAGQVGWLVHPSESFRRTKGDLARQLGVKLSNALDSSESATGKTTVVAPVDLSAYPAVQAELDRVTGDRSSDVFRVLSACRSAGFTLGQASNVVKSRPDLAAKLTECGGDDLTRIWIKLCDEQQRRELDDPSASASPARNADARTTAPAMPKLWRATDLSGAARPRWLAKNRLPRAAVTLLVGEEGIGKSLLWVWMIAALTTGAGLPEFGIPAGAPQVVVIVITEDDWETTVLPRLIVAGVNVDMLRVICTDRDGSGAPVFPRDLYLVTDAVESGEQVALVVIDAWLDTVPAGLSVRDPQQARQALHPFKELASRTDCAVLLLCHTNRVSTPNARDRYGATGELRKKARMTLFAQADEDGHLIVGPEKMNTAKPIPASTFTITSVQHFEPTEDHDGTVPLLSYLGESDQTAREHLADAYAADREIGGDSGDVVAWLAAELGAGPRWAVDIQMAADWAGHSAAKLKRAKRTLHVASTRHGANGPWFWRLPQHTGIPEDAQKSLPDPWTSGTSGLLAGDAPTSQDVQRMNGETRRPLAPVGNVYGELCECGKFPARLDSGYCEWCTAKNRRAL